MPKLKTEEKPTIEAEHPAAVPVKKENPEKQGEPVKIARAATQLALGTADTSRRAEMAGTMQSSIGNERLGQMMNPGQSGSAPTPGPTIQRQKDKSKKDPPPITTPLPEEAVRNPTGAADMESGGVSITILPDQHSKKKIFIKGREVAAHTRAIMNWKTPANYDTENGKISRIDPVPQPTLKIWTTYGPGSTSESKSAYGKGTTPEDIQAGKTSLGYHEGSHGLDYMEYVKNNPVPQFQGKEGMTVREYKQAAADYHQQMKKYYQDLLDYSEQLTDCVGTKADFCPVTEK